jgi:hypothetical protein
MGSCAIALYGFGLIFHYIHVPVICYSIYVHAKIIILLLIGTWSLT